MEPDSGSNTSAASQSGNHSTSFTYSNSTFPNPSRSHTMVTRSQNNIFKPKKLLTATKHDLLENLEPSTVTRALKIPHWRQACSAEFDALLNNGTWTLVPREEAKNLVGCK